MSEERNSRPQEQGSKIPYIALGVLVLMISALLYAGYEYIADDAAEIGELSGTPLDTTGRDTQPAITESVALQPESVDASQIDGSPVLIPEINTDSKEDIAEATKPVKEKVKKEEAKPTKTEAPKIEKPEATPVVPSDLGGEEVTYIIKSGETFYGLANRYNLKWSTLKALNPEIKDDKKDVKSNVTKIRVRVRAVHTVGSGDILRVVAEKYGITVEQLMAANGKKKNFAERGEKLFIPFKDKK